MMHVIVFKFDWLKLLNTQLRSPVSAFTPSSENNRVYGYCYTIALQRA